MKRQCNVVAKVMEWPMLAQTKELLLKWSMAI